MPFTLQQTVPPSAEPLAVSDVIDALRLDSTDPTPVIQRLITAARMKVEVDSGRQLLPATWLLTLDSFPYQWNTERQTQLFLQRSEGRNTFALQQGIQLPRPPLTAIAQIQFIDTDLALETLDADSYQVDTQSEPGRVCPAYGLIWPIAVLEPNAVQITYTAGYADTAAIPANLVQAIISLVGYWYRFREAASESPPEKVPYGYEALIDISRVRIFW